MPTQVAAQAPAELSWTSVPVIEEPDGSFGAPALAITGSAWALVATTGPPGLVGDSNWASAVSADRFAVSTVGSEPFGGGNGGSGLTWRGNSLFGALADAGGTTAFRSFASSDNGATWSQDTYAGGSPSGGGLDVVAFTDDNLALVERAGSNCRAVTSADGGVSFASATIRTAQSGCDQIVRVSSTVGYMATENGDAVRVHKTEDAGVSWDDPAAIATESGMRDAVVCGTGLDLMVLWTTTANLRFATSDNGTANWGAVANAAVGDGSYFSLGCLALDASTYFVTYNHQADATVLRYQWTTDRGGNWTSGVVVTGYPGSVADPPKIRFDSSRGELVVPYFRTTTGFYSVSYAPVSGFGGAVPGADGGGDIVTVLLDATGNLFGTEGQATTALLGLIVFATIVYLAAKAGPVPMAAMAVVGSAALWRADLLPLWVTIVVALFALAFAAKRLG